MTKLHIFKKLYIKLCLQHLAAESLNDEFLRLKLKKNLKIGFANTENTDDVDSLKVCDHGMQ